VIRINPPQKQVDFSIYSPSQTNSPTPINLGFVFCEDVENLSIRNTYLERNIHETQFNYGLDSINVRALELEINYIIRTKEEKIPIPQYLVKMATSQDLNGNYLYPEIMKIKQAVLCKIATVDAVVLPGGTSIHPQFFGEFINSNENADYYEKDSRRSLMEFFLINECDKKGIPLLCVCRGHQSLNIYYGGHIDRSSTGESQQHTLRNLNTALKTSSFMGPFPKKAYFHHRQTVTCQGEGLEKIGKILAVKDLEKEHEKIEEWSAICRFTLGDSEEFLKTHPGNADAIAQRNGALEEIKGADASKLQVARELNFLEQDEVVIAVESLQGAPKIGVQYHPEYVNDKVSGATPEDIEANQVIVDNFIEIARTKNLYHQLQSKIPRI
jgi:gamma-glutamyl-gamma-aminobutyrate hydrolase PuuD